MKIKNIDTKLIHSGDILCVGAVKGKRTLFSWGIQELTKSNVNHVGTLIWKDVELKKGITQSQLFLMEASLFGGYVETPMKQYFNRYEKGKQSLCVVRVNPLIFESQTKYMSRLKRSIDICKSWVGKKKYDKTAIIGFAFICVFKNLGRKQKSKANWLQRKNKLFCSESVCESWYHPTDSNSLFIGEHDKLATCATISPKDIRKSKAIKFVTGDTDLK